MLVRDSRLPVLLQQPGGMGPLRLKNRVVGLDMNSSKAGKAPCDVLPIQVPVSRASFPA